MTITNFILLVAIVGIASIFLAFKFKSNAKNRIMQEVIDLHEVVEYKIAKVIQLQIDLKQQIDTLKKEAQTIKKAAKKRIPTSGMLAPQKEATAKADRVSANIMESKSLLQYLAELEENWHSLKEILTRMLQNKKNTISKTTHDKVAAAQATFAELNDQFEKSIERIGAVKIEIQYE